MRGSLSKSTCSKVEAIAVFVGLSEKDSDLHARKTIVVLQRNARRDYHRRLLFRTSFFFPMLASRCEFAIQLLSKSRIALRTAIVARWSRFLLYLKRL